MAGVVFHFQSNVCVDYILRNSKKNVYIPRGFSTIVIVCPDSFKPLAGPEKSDPPLFFAKQFPGAFIENKIDCNISCINRLCL